MSQVKYSIIRFMAENKNIGTLRRKEVKLRPLDLMRIKEEKSKWAWINMIVPPLIPVFISTPDWQTMAPASAFTLSPGANASVNIEKLGCFVGRFRLESIRSDFYNCCPQWVLSPEFALMCPKRVLHTECVWTEIAFVFFLSLRLLLFVVFQPQIFLPQENRSCFDGICFFLCSQPLSFRSHRCSPRAGGAAG